MSEVSSNLSCNAEYVNSHIAVKITEVLKTNKQQRKEQIEHHAVIFHVINNGETTCDEDCKSHNPKKLFKQRK